MDTARGERAAIVATQLVEHFPYLLRVARSRVRDENLAEEAVQETLLAALAGARTFDGRAKFRTWLTGILLHKIHDGFRFDAREAAWRLATEALSDDAAEVHAAEKESGAAIEWRTPEHALYCKQIRDAIARALKTLPPRQAEAFLLREIAGLDSEQLGRTLGVSTNNVWVLLHRARGGLRSALEREGYSCA